MDASGKADSTPARNPTTVERKSDRELVVSRTFDAPARVVYRAWTTPELFTRWWAPRSFGLTILSCELDVRVGGSYRLVLGHRSAPEPMAFFGRYLEVTPDARLAWTNEEGGEGGAVTTVAFVESGGKTLVVVSDLHPTREALDAAVASGSTSGMGETFDQLEEVLSTLAPTASW